MAKIPAPRGLPLAERILTFRVESSDGCWRTNGARNRQGYGVIGVRRADGKIRNRYLHCVAYEEFVGPIPDGLEVHHECHQRDCFRPAHLLPVSHRENMLLNSYTGGKARQTSCIHGHPLLDPNLYVRPNGTRACKTCRRRRCREAYHAKVFRKSTPPRLGAREPSAADRGRPT
jgi:hypothetical protein